MALIATIELPARPPTPVADGGTAARLLHVAAAPLTDATITELASWIESRSAPVGFGA